MATEKNFNATTPAAPAGFVNAIWQVATSPSGNDPNTGQPVYPASCYVPIAENKGTVGLTIDGGGTVPPTGIKGFLQLPWAATITGWTVIADQSGSASIDVWFIAGSAPPATPTIPTSANKISASAPAALSSAQAASGGATAIGTWTVGLTQWGTVGFNLSSVTTCTRLTLEIQVTKQ